MTAVSITGRARDLLERVERERGTEVAIVLNDGCCDGMGPSVVAEPMVGANDVRIGDANGFDVYVPAMRRDAREGYDLVFDAVEAEGVGSFSLEVPLGYRLTVEERRR